ncbi:MAG: endonuclease/exonuclease/phosphatase family protein, partial [Kordiimonas sp.]
MSKRLFAYAATLAAVSATPCHALPMNIAAGAEVAAVKAGASYLVPRKQLADGGIDLRVLSYNINGLPAPIKTGKQPHYKRMVEMLKERRAEGSQPHVVLLQEAFDKKSEIVAKETGYKYVLKGPTRKDESTRGQAHWVQKTRKAYASFSDPQKFLGSGLWILSDYPIVDARHKAFNSDECAGLDCLSNKSIILARILVPGLSTPVDIVNSHFNSRRSAKAPDKAVFKAHQKQTDTLKWFLEKTDSGNPKIIAGDFNTKESRRYQYFKQTVGGIDAGEVCLRLSSQCDVDA